MPSRVRLLVSVLSIVAATGATLIHPPSATAQPVSPPPGAVEPTIAFGARHAVALKTNGDVLTWGENVMCQLGRPAGNGTGTPVLALRNGRKIAAASDHTLVVTTDGKVYGWGSNPEGALGTGDTYDKCEGPTLITSLSDKTIVDVATGSGFSVALTSNGDLYCTGDNGMGQCGVAKAGRSEVFAAVAIPELAGRVVAVKSGASHTLALTRDGELYAFGRGRDGQLGNGRTTNGVAQVTGLKGVAWFAAGTWHSVAVLTDGTAWAWGNNAKSQLCDGTTTNRAVATRISLASPEPRATTVAAGGHVTLVRDADGRLFGCGDNQFGGLGSEHPAVVAKPAVIASGTHASGTAAGGGIGAFSTDGCAVRMAGSNDRGIASGGSSSVAPSFAVRVGLSLCGARPAEPLPTLIRVAPTGGASNCWTKRVEEDSAAAPMFARLREGMLTAETLLKQNAAFMSAPVPVRMRASMSAGPGRDSGARLHVKAVPERKPDGTRLWSKECEVIPQVDRIGGAMTQISVFFNTGADGLFLNNGKGEAPRLTGRFGGYPEYNGWVLITKDGRLPWIPRTLADYLQEEGERRRRALADWNKSRAGIKPADPAWIQKTAEMLKATDPAGAAKFVDEMTAQAAEVKRQQQEVHPAITTGLEQQLAEFEKYRASFSEEQLRSPAVRGDESGDGKRRLDAEIDALRNLTPDEQRQADEWSRQASALQRQAQAARADATEAARLRSEANALGLKVRALRQLRMEKAGPLISAASARYDLANLQPGPAERAISYRPDPTFLEAGRTDRIQMIAIAFSDDPDPKQVERRAWQRRVKDTFDFAALAALLK